MRRLGLVCVLAALLLGIAAVVLAATPITDWTITGGDGIEDSPCLVSYGGICTGWRISNAWPEVAPEYTIITQSFEITSAANIFTLSYTINDYPSYGTTFILETPCGNTVIDATPSRIDSTVINCSSPQLPGVVDFIYFPLAESAVIDLYDVTLTADYVEDGGGPPSSDPFRLYIPLLYLAGSP